MISPQDPFLSPPWMTRPVIFTFQAGPRVSPVRDSHPAQTTKIFSPISSLPFLAKLRFTLISALTATHKISAFSSCTPVRVRVRLNWTLIFCNDAPRSITRASPWPFPLLSIPNRLSAPHHTLYRPTPQTRLDSVISLPATSQHSISWMRHCMGPTRSGEVPG